LDFKPKAVFFSDLEEKKGKVCLRTFSDDHCETEESPVIFDLVRKCVIPILAVAIHN
jgi:hypothetical protein